MLRALRNIFRLIAIARTLARYDALFPADWLPATGGLVFAARTLSGFRTAPGIRDLRPGERLAGALQDVERLEKTRQRRIERLGPDRACVTGQRRPLRPPEPRNRRPEAGARSARYKNNRTA